MFKKKGIFFIDSKDGLDEDSLMAIVLEAGAEDLQTGDEQFEVTCAPEDFEAVMNALEVAQIKWSGAQITMVPDTTIALQGDDAVKLAKMVEALEEHDDVQEVYGNFELPAEEEDD
jgi:transcriptional/translational regulatory protein YebC/TACO1